MRNYTETEKDKIKKMVAVGLLDSNVGTYIANVSLNNRIIQFCEDTKAIKLIFLPEDREEALFSFFETVSLLDYLEKQYQIFLHKNANQALTGNALMSNLKLEVEMVINTLNNESRKSSDFTYIDIPTDIFSKLIEYTQSYFFISSELKELVKNDFKSYEQMQLEEAKKQSRFARRTLIVSVITILITIMMSAINSCKENMKSQVSSGSRQTLSTGLRK